MDQQQQRKKDGGYLFPNAKKSDKQPDWRGKATIDGKEWLVSGWNRNQDGENMISFSFTDPATLPPRQGQGQGAQQGAAEGQGTPFNKPAAQQPQPTQARPQQPSPASEGYPDLDDLEDLFNS